MVGCFNISLFSYFDIHSIFDLVSYSMWDFVLWWFDLDFLIFDFNFDFILCISFLFIFLIHFFLNLLFSFLINYVTLNFNINILNHPIFLNLTLISFVTFLFNTCLIICLNTIEVFNILSIVCFQDFVGFFEVLSLHSNSYNSLQTYNFYIYILFYYILSILNNLTIVALRFFFSYTYESYFYTDYNININSIDINCNSLLVLWTLHNNYINNILLHVYSYLYQLNVNFLVTFLLVLIFYEFSIFYVNSNLLINWLFINNSKNLLNLNISYTVNIGNHNLAEITHIHLFTYIIFLINYFGILVNDFNYINFIISTYLILYVFTYYCININYTVFKWFNNQLTFLTSF